MVLILACCEVVTLVRCTRLPSGLAASRAPGCLLQVPVSVAHWLTFVTCICRRCAAGGRYRPGSYESYQLLWIDTASAPRFSPPCRYACVEISPVLAALQRRRVAKQGGHGRRFTVSPLCIM